MQTSKTGNGKTRSRHRKIHGFLAIASYGALLLAVCSPESVIACQEVLFDKTHEGIVTLIVLGRKGPHGFPFRRPHSHFPIH